MNIIKNIYERILTPIAKNRKKSKKNFENWLEKNKLSNIEIEKQKNYIFEYEPKISIVVPLYNTKEEYFKELISSINNQTYSNIELCLADGSDSKITYINKYLNEKIKYKNLNVNKGIVGNTNEALKMVTGEYVAFMDHDDILKINAIYEVVKSINENRNAQFIYTDDDKILDGVNKEIEPQFKPDFSEDMLYSNNYICHLTVLKKQLVDKIGYLNEEYEGAQDYDYILRAVEKIEDKSDIIHIPKIVYNWRINDNSVAYSAASKPYAYENGKRALKDYFKRKEIEVKVNKTKLPGFYKIEYLQQKEEKITIIIRDKSNKRQLRKCIKNIKKSTYQNYEIIVTNTKTAKEEKKIIEKIESDYILFINSDVCIKKQTIKELITIYVRKDAGIVSGKILTRFGKVYQIGRTITKDGKIVNIAQGKYNTEPGYMGRLIINQNVLITAHKMFLIKKKEYLNLVNTNENDEEIRHIELCIKMYEKGRNNIFIADAEAIIKSQKDIIKRVTQQKLDKYKGKDPYLNLNLKI